MSNHSLGAQLCHWWLPSNRWEQPRCKHFLLLTEGMSSHTWCFSDLALQDTDRAASLPCRYVLKASGLKSKGPILNCKRDCSERKVPLTAFSFGCEYFWICILLYVCTAQTRAHCVRVQTLFKLAIPGTMGSVVMAPGKAHLWNRKQAGVYTALQLTRAAAQPAN